MYDEKATESVKIYLLLYGGHLMVNYKTKLVFKIILSISLQLHLPLTTPFSHYTCPIIINQIVIKSM